MHVEGIRDLAPVAASLPKGVVIRPGRREDLDHAEEVDLAIYRIQARAPSFASLPLDREARQAEWLEVDFDEQGLSYVVAEAGGKIVGQLLIFGADPVLGIGHDAAALVAVSVLEERRGEGIGLALFAEIVRRAVDAGYARLVTNWRITNLSASRFWPARGFRPIYHRLHRAIGVG